MTETRVRHICSLSGGKDSTALAIMMRDKVQDMEYVFSDTDKELPETYTYLEKLEAYLGKEIVRLHSERTFDHWLEIYGGYLPSSQMRWCTKMLKIRPFEEYIGDDEVHMYIGIRADEDRAGYRPSKTNIHPVYPFIDEGMTLDDIHRVLDESGIGFPDYYSWRSRSGCYFCFYQQKREWLGLLKNHPELFKLAKKYEEDSRRKAGEGRHTWNDGECLEDLEDPDRQADIWARYLQRVESLKKANSTNNSKKLLHILGQDEDEDEDMLPCSFCHI